MAYAVLANRYRPRTFEEVVGQGDTSRVLRSALAAGRAAHAFLFSGPRGVGKTSMARILAKAFDCLRNAVGDPCGECTVCRAIDGGGSLLDVAEIDGASHNKVENVRDLIENLRYRPAEARYRITIIDEVHMLSSAAFNALLKTLEEPPAHAKFILATTEPLKVPETIRSRCQQFDFRRLSGAEIAGRLADICRTEGVPAEPALLERIARHAQGGLRDALSLLDQLITYGNGQPSVEAFERLTGRLPAELLQRIVAEALAGNGAAVHVAVHEAFERGARPADVVGQLSELLEGLLVTTAGGVPADRTDEERAALAALAGSANVDQVLSMLDVLVEAAQRLRQRHDGRLVVEMATLTLARLPSLQPVVDLLAGRTSPAPEPAVPVPRATQPPLGARTRETPPARPPADEHADLRARLAEAAPRSLRLELLRYPEFRVQGDELVVVPPADGAGLLHDPRGAELPKVLARLAKTVLGRELAVRVEGAAPTASGQAASPASSSAGRSRRSSDSGDPISQRLQEQWPGAERVE